MKFFIIVTTLFLIMSSFASDQVETTINGKKYICSPQNGSSNASACLELASRGIFSNDEAFILCVGATNNAPAECAIEAFRDAFTKDQSLELCKGAYSTGPIDCAKKLFSGVFTKDEAITFCSFRAASAETASCVISATNRNYSREDAAKLCRANR